MKPEIVIQDFGGRLAGQMDVTRSRLMKGMSWKKTRIIWLIPAGDSIPPKVYLSHLNVMFPPNQPVVRILTQGMEIGEAYSRSIEGILGHPDLKNWEYLLTVEHDNMPPADGVLNLVKQMEAHPELACIGGLYFTKGEGGVAQIWGDVKDPILNYRPQPPQPGQLVECCGTGMGFNLWRLSMFQDTRLKKPWFETLAGKSGIGTQDLAFWTDARKYGYRAAVDCAVTVGHYDASTDTVW